MPIITKAGSPVKGSPTQFTLSKPDLLLLVSDPYFLDTDNWKEVQLRYKSSTGKQKETVKFDAAITPCVSDFSVSLRANNEFLIHSIVIKDFDNGSFKIPRSALTSPELEFDVVLVPPDNIAPTVSSISGPNSGTYVTNDVLSFTVNFSETVLVTGSPILKLDIGGVERNASYISGSNSSALVFEYTVVSLDNDSDGIQATSIALNSGTIKDAANNNANLSFSTQTFSGVLVDNTAPTVSSISGPNSGIYVASQNLSFTVNFSETVLVTGSPILKLDIGGVERNASYASGSNSSALVFEYTVVSLDNDSDGIQATSLVLNSGAIKDAANNSANLSFSTQTFSGVLVDNTAPTVSSISGPNSGTYVTNDVLSFTVNFSETVLVTGSPILKLYLNGITRSANYVSGSNSSALVFQYTITGFLDVDMDGIDILQNSLILNSGTIKDAANNNANLSHSAYTFTNVLVQDQFLLEDVVGLGPTGSVVNDSIMLSDSSIVYVGAFTLFQESSSSAPIAAPRIIKFLSNGQVDTAFMSNIGSGFDSTVTNITSDGTNLYVGGAFTGFNGIVNNARYIAKLSTSGVFDTTFSNNLDITSGTKAATSGFDSNVSTITVDGTSLYIGGTFTRFKNFTNNANRIAKLSTSGVFDATFSNNLDVVSGTKAATSGFNSGVSSIVTDGTSLYIGGSFTQFKNTANNARYVAKLSTSGVFDTTFSNNLDVVSGTKAATSGFSASVYSIVTDGTNLYVGGAFNQFKGANISQRIAKLSTSGVFDTSFSNNLGTGFNSDVNTITIDGTSLYLGGNFTAFQGILYNASYIAKLSTSGVFDTTFSNNLDVVSGTKAATSGFNSTVTTIAVDGASLYVGGNFKKIKNQARNCIGKIANSGTLEANFNNHINNFNNIVRCVFTDITGTYVGGQFASYREYDAPNIIKFLPNGQVDTVFMNNIGSGLNGIVYAIASDGTNLYVGGAFTGFNGITNNARFIAKLSTSGVFDTDFSNNLDISSGVKQATSGFDTTVNTIAVDGTSLYVGGTFTRFKNITNNANRIAKLSTAGVFDTAFSDSLDVVSGTKDTFSGFSGGVNTIAVDGTNLYVGGIFTQFKNVANNANRIAKLSTAGVFDTAFSDSLDVSSGVKQTTSGFNNGVNTIVIDGTNLHVGGTFTQFKNVANSARSIAKLSTSGVFDTAFSNNLDVVSGTKAATSGFNSTISTMAIDGTNLYVGGAFTQFKNVASNANRIAKISTSGVFDTTFSDSLDITSGTKATTSGFNSAINTIAIYGSNLYIGGGFTTIGKTIWGYFFGTKV